MSTTPSQIRRLAFKLLFLLDARDGEMPEAGAWAWSEDEGSDDGSDPVSPHDEHAEQRARSLAIDAYGRRAECDDVMRSLAPAWPAHRQPAVDRAILRLAYHEMISGATPPKIAINEAVELAKAFGTEKSPGFVNALLDKVLKRQAASAERALPNATEG